ncbi:hypothetical protein [Ramlibacter albus]|uniref:GH18 domain-containing protein n=1 Tax=Ramlibacter albus TaxID=2079448 RepID=A0A923M607_9BURK|nr:hypothetical protein [Ramlibacter albus]MBC5764595.1 hypothetical protein [Ramlibacter albus]
MIQQFRMFAAALALAWLSACGGGGGSGGGAHATASTRPLAQAQRSAETATGQMRVYQAFFGRAPTAAEWAQITAPTAEALATSYFTGIPQMGDAELSAAVLSHMNVNSQTVNAASLAVLQAALTQYFAAYGNMARGVIANNLANLLAGLTNDATWGTAARAFNAQVAAACTSLSACSGSGAQKVGEIFSSGSELATSELRITFGYAGNLPTSRAIQAAGKQNILDMLFMGHGPAAGDKLAGRLAPDVEQQLAAYVSANQALLVPGVRVLVADEVFWNPADTRDTDAVLRPQLEALRTAVALVRRYLPNAMIGATLSPYATFGRPNTVAYMREVIPLLDWVGTDPYWFGDPGNVQALNDWTAGFVAMAKAANPRVETWYIAQAFRFPNWDLATYRAFTARQLELSLAFDGVLIFGWQFVSEIDPSTAGKFFDAETRRLYARFLLSP